MPTVKVDLSGLTELQSKIEQLKNDKDDFYRNCLKDLAMRILRKVVKRTPTGTPPYWAGEEIVKKYWSGYTGGTMRRGWTAKTEEEAKSGSEVPIPVHVAGLDVKHEGNDYIIVVQNPVHYASFVEYGHRQQPGRFVPHIGRRLVKSWVQGQFMLKISEDELRSEAPAVIERKMQSFLEEVFNGK